MRGWAASSREIGAIGLVASEAEGVARVVSAGTVILDLVEYVCGIGNPKVIGMLYVAESEARGLELDGEAMPEWVGTVGSSPEDGMDISVRRELVMLEVEEIGMTVAARP